MASNSCRHYNLYRQILLIVNQVLVCGTCQRPPFFFPTFRTHFYSMLCPTVLLTLRIYALYNRSKPILAYMLISGAILAGVACVRFIHIATCHGPTDRYFFSSMSCLARQVKSLRHRGAILGWRKYRTYLVDSFPLVLSPTPRCSAIRKYF
jgi:hypothetical protein